MRVSMIVATTVFTGMVGFFDSVIQPAQAREYCRFVANDLSGRSVEATGSHRRIGVACDRAKRRCIRKLKRKIRQHKFGRTSGCLKVVQAR